MNGLRRSWGDVNGFDRSGERFGGRSHWSGWGVGRIHRNKVPIGNIHLERSGISGFHGGTLFWWPWGTEDDFSWSWSGVDGFDWYRSHAYSLYRCRNGVRLYWDGSNIDRFHWSWCDVGRFGWYFGDVCWCRGGVHWGGSDHFLCRNFKIGYWSIGWPGKGNIRFHRWLAVDIRLDNRYNLSSWFWIHWFYRLDRGRWNRVFRFNSWLSHLFKVRVGIAWLERNRLYWFRIHWLGLGVDGIYCFSWLNIDWLSWFNRSRHCINRCYRSNFRSGFSRNGSWISGLDGTRFRSRSWVDGCYRGRFRSGSWVDGCYRGRFRSWSWVDRCCRCRFRNWSWVDGCYRGRFRSGSRVDGCYRGRFRSGNWIGRGGRSRCRSWSWVDRCCRCRFRNWSWVDGCYRSRFRGRSWINRFCGRSSQVRSSWVF